MTQQLVCKIFDKSCFKENLSQIFPILVMGAAYLFFVTSAFNYRHLFWFPWLISSRIALGFLAAILVALLSFKNVKSKQIDCAYITLCLAIQASHGVLEGPNNTDFYNYTGILFISAALSYKGTFLIWLKRFFPLQFLCILLPILLKQHAMKYAFSQIVDTYSFTLACLFIGTALARISATKHNALFRNISLQSTLIKEQEKKQEKYLLLTNLIQGYLAKKSLTLDKKTGTHEQISEINETLEILFNKLDQYEIDNQKNASLIALGQSTAMVAHDVRKPLASMKALLTALPSIKDDPNELKKIVTTVDRNISQTNAMLNDILEFSRDSTSLDLKENNPSGLITSALGDALRNHPGSNVRIEYNLKHLYALKSDVVRITRVLTNIIDNALDAMTSPQTGKASGSLFFETYETERDGPKFGGIVVSDNGPGIPKDALDRIFDPFFTHGKKGGTGLGLAICHRVISLHGGVIRADNREDGKGARFTIELPLGKDRVGSNESEIIRHSSELEQFRIEEAGRVDYGDTANTSEFLRINKERGRKSYLLILDDEPLFRESIRAILSELKEVRDHVKVVEAESAETAFRIFDAREFDYAIADIDLGRGQMNGYDFSQIVLKKYANTRVLIHSNKRKGELDRNIRATASDKFMGFLPKPMRSSELLQFLACKSFEVPSNHRTIEPANRRKVLVVNDDDSLIVAFKVQLRSPDVQVLSAGNVSDALKRITEQKVDVILSDINLGNDEPTGYDLLIKVREKDKSVPFYMISGYSESDEGPKARDLGATGYLQLPVEGSQLKKTILPSSS